MGKMGGRDEIYKMHDVCAAFRWIPGSNEHLEQRVTNLDVSGARPLIDISNRDPIRPEVRKAHAPSKRGSSNYSQTDYYPAGMLTQSCQILLSFSMN